ncbi:ABC transporter ATP-binding protein [Candidatus Geothermarchaeota archaeon]|nr:MAG: ABC transporter ATP-binding protein [Candidatus Geothermarchaeota archaeon]
MKILEVKGLKTYYYTRKGVVKAVDNVNLTLEEREVLGLVGESGSGKSTLAYSIIRMVPEPGKIVSGHIYFKNIDLLGLTEEELRRYRWRHISMIFQGAMNALDPIFTVKDQIIEAILAHEKDMDREKAEKRAKELIKLVGLSHEVLDRYPFELSGGMKQRVVIAMALALNPSIVIADEPTTALDVTMQRQILSLFKDLKRELDISFIVISHDISMVSEIADTIAIMYAGKIIEHGKLEKTLSNPIHPYTKGLIKSVLSMYEEEGGLFSIPGEPPNLINIPSGCRFYPRCPYAKNICKIEYPAGRYINGSYVECHYAEDMTKLSVDDLWRIEIYG